MTERNRRIDKRHEKGIEGVVTEMIIEPDIKTDSSEEENVQALGLDIGTSKIVLADKLDSKIHYTTEKNAFIKVEYSKFTEGILKQNEIRHYKMGNSLIVYGDGAEIFANMMNIETRRPMRKGLLNPREAQAIEIIKGIIDDLLSFTSKGPGTKLCFSIPGAPRDAASDIIYHETVLRRYLTEKGYAVKSINEGLAVVFSELEDENFSGLGISMGGGICNVCLAFLSVPLLTFSFEKGGDYIDEAVASVTGEVTPRVRDIKENELDLNRKPSNEVEDALHIYYDDLILSLIEGLKEAIARTSKIPRFDKPIKIVLSGGTAKPNGFRSRFEQSLKRDEFPLKISDVCLARDPLNATAKGALIASLFEG